MHHRQRLSEVKWLTKEVLDKHCDLSYFQKIAVRESLKSSYFYKLGAVLVNKNKVIGKGRNKVASGTRSLHIIHAEHDCLRKADKRKIKGSVLFVCRITTGNKQLALAKPCELCQRRLRKNGVRVVYYSLEDGTWGMLKL